MISKIDWISFTLPLPGTLSGAGDDTCAYVETLLRTSLGDDIADAVLSRSFSVAPGRAPYEVRMMREDAFLSVFWGGQQKHVLVEITGGGCEDLERRQQLQPLLTTIQPRLTRLDVAVDMPVATTPAEFVGAGYSKRIKSSSHMVSETGETFYVGSRDSERYARVYRYNAPHPRSLWLRCEFVLRHENATDAVAKIRDVGFAEYVSRLGNSFGWQHAAWQPDKVTDAVASAWRPERRHGATVRWLLTSVFPAMAKLHDQGVIEDMDEFLDQHLYTLIK